MTFSLCRCATLKSQDTHLYMTGQTLQMTPIMPTLATWKRAKRHMLEQNSALKLQRSIWLQSMLSTSLPKDGRLIGDKVGPTQPFPMRHRVTLQSLSRITCIRAPGPDAGRSDTCSTAIGAALLVLLATSSSPACRLLSCRKGKKPEAKLGGHGAVSTVSCPDFQLAA